MKEVFDFKKKYKALYLPKVQPALIDVPEILFIKVDGTGDPNNNPSYQEAIEILYSISYAIKMSKNGSFQPEGYFDYVVPPLEGLWSISDNKFDFHNRSNWIWTMMLRQPDFVNKSVFEWAISQAKKKRPSLNFNRVRLESYNEGLCVQLLHIGPYNTEPETLAKMHEYMKDNDLIDDIINERWHHEIYLSDPRKAVPEKMKTVLRHPINKK